MQEYVVDLGSGTNQGDQAFGGAPESPAVPVAPEAGPQTPQGSELSGDDPTRLAALAILDGLTALDPDDASGEQNAAAMQQTFTALTQAGAVELSFDEESEQVALDISPLVAAVLNLTGGLVATVAERDNVTSGQVVAAVRAQIRG